ncbi:hypothetical protein [Amycolatopsis sp. PS_44_ISF1]|uniref:hypothetical protein n=1 Tax=Amycolatopsis sp. PS_44_ISF1 TaxID=2974917 RepID=UPI0028DDB7D9|nr:hypothetical protein [Amycolatopsis sp. PS_44_ISF1]MDT8910907.1 hypothetical protein [Amycolatopsis sp. PS_44_ISF1]
MTLRTAQRADPAPWDQPGHPAQLNPSRGKTHRRLWDAEQAEAFARGEPVPALPPLGDPRDLLDRPEAAHKAGMSTSTWSKYEGLERHRTRAEGERPLVPAPDEEHGGVPFWYRATVETYRASRADPVGNRAGGRPAGRTDTVPQKELAARIAELQDKRTDDGKPLSVPEIAQRLGVHYRTALRYVTAARNANPVAPEQDRTVD